MSFVNIDSKALQEDNEVIFSSKASLVTMGKDILQFISEKLRERKMLQVKVEALEEKNKELKKDLESVADDL